MKIPIIYLWHNPLFIYIYIKTQDSQESHVLANTITQ